MQNLTFTERDADVAESKSYPVERVCEWMIAWWILLCWCHILFILFFSFLTTLQFARRRFGKRLGFSSTGSRIPRSTELGFTPARIRTYAWTTWRRTSAAPRSTRTWWPEWVHNHSWCLTVNLQHLMLCFSPAESSRRRWTWRVRVELPKWSHLLYCPSAKLWLSPAFSGLLLQDQEENVS